MANLGNIGLSGMRSGMLYGGMVSGTVHNELGAPASRTIMAFHRASGQLSGASKSDAATGAYVLLTSPTYGTEEHFVVELNPTGSENHRIRGFVTPNKGY